jgi:predicted small secreted protein
MKTLRILFVLALSAFVLAACASDGGSGSSNQGGGSYPAGYSAAPDGSLFADVHLDANEYDVRKLLGEPDRANAYMTGKAWIPFYFGSDVARTDWFYRGQGRVVFSRSRYTGALKVIRILYSADEP